MATIVRERVESREVVRGRRPSAQTFWWMEGFGGEAIAQDSLRDTAPSAWDLYGDGSFFLPRDDYGVRQLSESPDLYDGWVRYAIAGQSVQFAFETGGGTARVFNSLVNVGRYALPGSPAPDFKGAIGVTADNVEGADIVVPTYQFSETRVLNYAIVTPAYKAGLFACTGTVNLMPYKGFNTGELLFLGAAGQQRGSGDWEVQFRWVASPNVTNLPVGDITGIAKDGWDYLWVVFNPDVDTTAKFRVRRPLYAYIERVYKRTDFFALLGFA